MNGELLTLEHDPRVAVSRAAEVLKAAGVVVFPTDTVYGLLAGTNSRAAYRRVFELKQRSADNPLALLAVAGGALDRLARTLLGPFPAALKSYSTGTLTLIVEDESVPAAALPSEIRCIQPGSVGLRTPAHELVQALLAQVGGLVWATSANACGEPPASSAAEVERWLASLARPPELVVVSSRALAGLPSDLVRLSGDRLLTVSR